MIFRSSNDEEVLVIDETIEIENLLKNVTDQLISTTSENLCALKCLIREQKNENFGGDGINVLYKIQIYLDKPNEILYRNIKVSDTLLNNIRKNLVGSKDQNICVLNILISDLQKVDSDDNSDSDLENEIDEISQNEEFEKIIMEQEPMHEEIICLDD